MNKSDDHWKKKLSDQQYRVLRQKGTESPFSGKLLHNKETGVYLCAGCGEKVFDSKDKFDSGSGWPSFTEVSSSESVRLKEDFGHGMHRTEVSCKNCGGHLGHVFDDGPVEATGKRYCINSLSLDFKPKDQIS